MQATRRLFGLAIATALLAGCIPPPADIGLDYSGPLYRKPGADDPRVVTSASVLPPGSSDCEPVTEVPARKRSDCGVRLVMERYNPGLQTLYQRQLADEPMMRGNVILRLIIGADGGVQAADIASSEIHDPEFTRQVAAYVRTINFGALDAVPAWSDTYTVEFTPPKDVIPEKPVAPAGSTK
ncbi:MAG: AgmX/PglI C-terminal domain-containing protein [Pseudomonadota bacterium]